MAKDRKLCELTIQENSTIFIFGDEPFPEERFIDWNFVSSSKELIEEAKQKWNAQSFPKIEGDETPTSMPITLPDPSRREFLPAVIRRVPRLCK